MSKILNDNNGLPQNSVGSMYFDSKTNFLWLTTQAGLVRYDGVNTRVFDLRDLPSLQSIRLTHLFPTVDGKVLVRNAVKEVFSLNGNYPTGKVGNVDSTGTYFYWYGSARSIAGLNLEGGTASRHPGKFSPLTGSFWLNDSTWAAFSETTIGLFVNKALVAEWPLKNTFTFMLARTNFLYLGNGAGISHCINLTEKKLGATRATKVFRQGNPAFFYDKLNDQPLLINNDSLYELHFDKTLITAKWLATLKNLPDEISSVVVHPNKSFVFVSSNTAGLYIFRSSPFRIYYSPLKDETEARLDLNNTYATVLADSNLVFTSRSLLFNLTTRASQRYWTDNAQFLTIGLDTSKNVWVPHFKSVRIFGVGNGGRSTHYAPLSDSWTSTFYLSKKGRLWLANGSFLGYTEGRNVKEAIAYGGRRDSLAFLYLTETADGRLIGASRQGIYLIDPLRKQITLVLANSQVSEVRNLYIDSADRVWITTYGKGLFLYHLKEAKLVQLPVDEKGYLLYSHAFIDDGANHFLLPTNKGLFRLRKENLLQIAASPQTPLLFQYFDVSDGLLTNEFNGGCQPAFNRLPNGDLLLPSLQGLVRVAPGQLPVPGRSPLFVDAIQTKKGMHKPEVRTHFEADERTQTWHISTARWGEANSQNIFYRTDDDDAWQRLPTGEQKIQLSELAGGDHVLHIKNQYGLLKNAASTFRFPFYVAKRYYETLWFWLLLVVLLTGVLFFVNRFRNLRLEQNNKKLQGIIKDNTRVLFEKNAELEETLLDLNAALSGLKEASLFKNRLIGLLGHDILVPLRFIANISEHLYNDTTRLNFETARESSGEIKTTAAQLLYLGESLIQWIKLEEGTFRLFVRTINLEELANSIVQVHQPMAAVKKNTIRCDMPPGLSCVQDPTLVKVILHNLLLNANKFTAGGTITVQAAVADGMLTVSVADTGTGMEPDVVTSLNNLMPVASQDGTAKETGWGMGYMLIIDLLRFANGTLKVESHMGVGTKVSFSLACP